MINQLGIGPLEIIGMLVAAGAVGLLGWGWKVFFAGAKAELTADERNDRKNQFTLYREEAKEFRDELRESISHLQKDVTYIKNNGLDVKERLRQNTNDIAVLEQRVRSLEKL